MTLSLRDRYSRQILFPGIGAEGQRQLANSKVAIVGCGATGSTMAALLARSGLGYIRIIDRDYVEASNLQRQILFDESDAAESIPKAVAAANKLCACNSEITVEAQVADLVAENIHPLLNDVQLVLDGTDNFETRYLINDCAVKNGIPWIYTAAVGGYAATMNVLPGESACLSCIFPERPSGTVETCDTVGILNATANLIASLACCEALKILIGSKEHMRRTLLSVDLWKNQRSEVDASRRSAECRTCQQREFVHLAGRQTRYITLCGRNSVQIRGDQGPVDFLQLTQRLAPSGDVRHNDYLLKFRREPYDMTLFADGRAIIKGTSDIAAARSFYARFVGS
jgi:molybdopterin/thiamine biosynthesis adenylyltransferase